MLLLFWPIQAQEIATPSQDRVIVAPERVVTAETNYLTQLARNGRHQQAAQRCDSCGSRPCDWKSGGEWTVYVCHVFHNLRRNQAPECEYEEAGNSVRSGDEPRGFQRQPNWHQNLQPCIDQPA